LAPVSTLDSVASVFRSTIPTLFSPPLLVKPRPLAPMAIPCTRGVFAMRPTMAWSPVDDDDFSAVRHVQAFGG
jgi:hypothetical protein